MISTEQAFEILEGLSYSPIIVEVPLFDARNGVLAETVFSPMNMPPFRQATMDGFALALHDELHYEIIGEVKAGDLFTEELKAGQAVKIFTGAAVPDSADAVIPIEKTTVFDSVLSVHERMNPQSNIRQLGAQILKDEVALEKGTIMNAASIGFLAGLGIPEIKVYKKPKIALVTTGNELVHHTQRLPKGKVYDSNTLMLTSALFNAHFEDIQVEQVDDNFTNTMRMLESSINENDIVIVTGGISVGDYDFVGLSLKALNGCLWVKKMKK
jgi:molybdopterin molybdotransferase